MTPGDFLIDPETLMLPWSSEVRPFGLVELGRGLPDLPPDSIVLPPFPVVGIGDRTHPLASLLDAVIEPGFAPSLLVEQACAQPEAAAVAVQLLRLIDGMAALPALSAESLAYGVLQGSAGHAEWLATRASEPPLGPGEVVVERDGDRLTILMNRPHARNAIDRPMRDGLRAAFELAALDPGIRQVVLRGAGRTFSVGADLAEFGTTRDPATAHAIRLHTLPAHAIARCAVRLTAHVQGACVGAGLEMAAFAARLTASPKAWFHLPELGMGLLPGAGGCVSITRRIGRQRTALLLLSGRRIAARTALEWGLVDALVDDRTADQDEPDVASQQP